MTQTINYYYIIFILTLACGWVSGPFRFFGTDLSAAGVGLEPVILFARVLDDATMRCGAVY